MNRPELTTAISVTDFRGFYWLKEELSLFCRQNGLPTQGSKTELTARIEQFLTNGSIIEHKPRPATQNLPAELSRDTVIGHNWRCSESLRAFFIQEIGSQFHFNGVMRDFIKNGAGKTLQEAIEVWHADKNSPKVETEIAPQFEYNQHIREFFKANPGKTLPEAIAAWKVKRALQQSNL